MRNKHYCESNISCSSAVHQYCSTPDWSWYFDLVRSGSRLHLCCTGQGRTACTTEVKKSERISGVIVNWPDCDDCCELQWEQLERLLSHLSPTFATSELFPQTCSILADTIQSPAACTTSLKRLIVFLGADAVFFSCVYVSPGHERLLSGLQPAAVPRLGGAQRRQGNCCRHGDGQRLRP